MSKKPRRKRRSARRWRACSSSWRWSAARCSPILVLFTGDNYQVRAEFQNAGQLVNGNEVVVGGANAGSVDRIELGPHGEALVTISVADEFAPLRAGRSPRSAPSLSGIAGRQIQLTLPADETAGSEIPDGGTLSEAETVSAVDLDQLFNTLVAEDDQGLQARDPGPRALL